MRTCFLRYFKCLLKHIIHSPMHAYQFPISLWEIHSTALQGDFAQRQHAVVASMFVLLGTVFQIIDNVLGIKSVLSPSAVSKGGPSNYLFRLIRPSYENECEPKDKR